MLLLLTLAFAPDYAVDLDGDGDYVTIDAFDPGSAFTVEGWIEWDDFHANGCCNMVVEAVDPGGTNAFGIAWNGSSWQVEINDNTVSEGDSCGDGVALCVMDSPATSTPIHLAVVVDGADVSLYLDAVLAGSSSFATGPVFSGHTWVFGADSDGTPYTSDNIDAALDEWRIWDTARSESELQCLKDWGLTGAEAGLQAHWNMNEGSGSSARDATGGGLDGTLSGDAAWITSPMGLTPSSGGDIGCLDYDGDGVTPDDGDCDDTDPDVNPGSTEIWYDGIDQDCDDKDDDQDGDGYPVATDCDDTDPASYPGAEGLTEDCEPVSTDTADSGGGKAGVEDTGDDGGKDDGCSCAAGRSPVETWPLLGLLGVLLRRRRR